MLFLIDIDKTEHERQVLTMFELRTSDRYYTQEPALTVYSRVCKSMYGGGGGGRYNHAAILRPCFAYTGNVFIQIYVSYIHQSRKKHIACQQAVPRIGPNNYV